MHGHSGGGTGDNIKIPGPAGNVAVNAGVVDEIGMGVVQTLGPVAKPNSQDPNQQGQGQPEKVQQTTALGSLNVRPTV